MRVRRLPGLDQVPPIPARARLSGIFRVGDGIGQEHGSSAAENHVDSIAVVEAEQLAGDISASLRRRCFRDAPLPVPLHHVGVGGAGGSVGNAGRRNDTRGKARGLRLFNKTRNLRPLPRGAIAPAHGAVHGKDAGQGFDPRDHRGHGARGIGGLLVGVVGFRKSHRREALEAELVIFPEAAGFLPRIDARRGDAGDPHAIADKENHVLGRLAPISRRLGGQGIGTRGAPIRGVCLRCWAWRGGAEGRGGKRNSKGEGRGAPGAESLKHGDSSWAGPREGQKKKVWPEKASVW